MKRKAWLIPLILGLILLAVGVGCFGRVCAVKDSIYSAYKLTFPDSSIEKVFINDNDEATVKADFDAAILGTATSAAQDAAAEAEAPAEGLSEEAAAELEAAGEAAEEAAEAAVEAAIEGASPYDTVIGSFGKVTGLRTAWKLQNIFLGIGALLCLAGIVLLLRAKDLDFASIMRSKITWAVIAEILLLIVCFIIRPDFLSISYQPANRMLYGNLVDIINRSAEITIIGMGMEHLCE